MRRMMIDWVTATQFRLGNDHYVVRPAAAVSFCRALSSTGIVK